ncbi:nuclear transport factor 2 family protein [Paraburkholderia sp. SARCC-3016]|uniref:nuclear transport factor 2 family protein n=1 Tax=Paraburkholderia sp. SARCC-3016 TaxID=3058611 RepID=UPI0028066D71|nr:nuclear transport factor 2 family protein [Paraburkholderia sp. SARCC-3016]MDQ7982290.1 nuclear transport factor 2 family protein [Paraburkholderia sp. SARCC-3016]
MNDEVISTLDKFFELLAAQKWEAANGLLASGFFAFENGTRYSAHEFIMLVKDVFANGTRYQWQVTKPEVIARADIAWVAYHNVGYLNAPGSARTGRHWLETAVLSHDGTCWKLCFLSSMRAEIRA